MQVFERYGFSYRIQLLFLTTPTRSQKNRLLVAYRTLLKNTADTLRDSLGIEPRGIHSQGTSETLPELTISEMSASEIRALVDGMVDGTVDAAEHGSVDHAIPTL